MGRWMGYSLQRKLSLIILLLTLIPLLFLGIYAYIISSRTTEEKMKQSGLDTLRQMQGNLRFIVRDVESMSLFLIGQSDIQQFMRDPAAWENVGARTKIVGLVTNLVTSKNYITDITLYHEHAEALSTRSIYHSDLEKHIRIADVTDKMWTELYGIESYSGHKEVISFIRPLRSINNYTNLGWLSISLDERIISRYWSEPKLGEGHGEVALINSEGKILSATDSRWLGQSINERYPGLLAQMNDPSHGAVQYQGGGKKTVLYYQEPLVGWTLVGVIPYEIYSEQNAYILKLTATTVAISVLVNAGLILFIVSRITNPLKVLTRLLSKVDPDEPLPVYTNHSDDEIGRLAQSYNMLGKHIKQLKEQLIRNEVRKKQADMYALQAQINPHFLYNTLSSIHWIALMTEERRIADMVGALSDFLRFSLNKGKEFCPVHQELTHIRCYMQVQSIRFPDKFEVDYVVDAQLNDKLMLKLLLQPLVENAMIHGIQKRPDKGRIVVCVERKGERMVFQVVDDGVGMTEEQLELIIANLTPSDEEWRVQPGYGLRNVNERLLLHYGPEAGLQIESRPQAGTRITFSIPIREDSQCES